HGRHNHPRRAEPALQPVFFPEAFLQRVQVAIRREALDRGDRRAVGLDREECAGLLAPAVDEDDVGAALTGVAPDVGPRQTQLFAQEVNKEDARVDVSLADLAVDSHRDLGQGLVFQEITSLIAVPMSAGLFTTVTPAAFSAAIFSAAVPLPPAMIAPAWPMRRPGGAVCPAMNPTTGFLNRLALIQAAASSSALPPISPIMMTASVSGSSPNSFSASMCVVPISGSPPMPMQVVCPMPRRVSWWMAS